MLHGKHQKGPGEWVSFKQGKTKKEADPFMPESPQGYDKKDVAAPVLTRPEIMSRTGAVKEARPRNHIPTLSDGSPMPKAAMDYREKFGVDEASTGFSDEDMASMYGSGEGDGDAALARAQMVGMMVNLYGAQSVDPRFR